MRWLDGCGTAGYLLAGSLVGPGGFGLINELVQVETLAQFGVVFLLFCLGAEFSVAKLRHVGGVAVLGGLLQVRCCCLPAPLATPSHLSPRARDSESHITLSCFSAVWLVQVLSSMAHGLT
jgi:Kef-type K+ transport system membrane component KefB